MTVAKPKVTVLLLPQEEGRKSRHLALIWHRGGGWYEVQCMGEGKRCKAGECKHTANMRWNDSERPIRQVPHQAQERAGGTNGSKTIPRPSSPPRRR